MKGLVKILLWLLGVLLLLVVVVAAFTQTQRFRDWLRDQIVALSRQKLNGRLTLGRLEGNLLSHFEIFDVVIERDRETVLRVPRIEFGFSAAELWDRRVLINQLIIDRPAIFLRQRPDSSWNVQNLIVTDTTAIWPVVLPVIQIRQAALTVAPLDTANFFFQHRVQKLNANLLVEYRTEQTLVELRNLAFELSDFPLAVHNLQAHLVQTGESVRIDDFRFAVGASQLAGSLFVRDFARPLYRLQLSAAPLQLSEVRAVVPAVPASGPVDLRLNVEGSRDSVLAALDFKHACGEGRLVAFARRDSVRVPFDLSATLRHADLAQLLPGRGPRSDLNLTLRLHGDRLSLDSLNARLALQADSSRLGDHLISTLSLKGTARDGQAEANLFIQTPVGEVSGQGRLEDWAGAQRFAVKLTAQRLNLAAFTSDPTLVSNVNLTASLQGARLHLDSLSASGTLTLSPSRIFDIDLAAATARFQSRAGEMVLDTLRLQTEAGLFEVEGRFNRRRIHLLHFLAKPGKLELLRRFLAADTLRAHGVIGGTVQGRFDSLLVHGGFHLSQVQFNTIAANSLTGEFNFEQSGEGAVQATGRALRLATTALDSAKLVATFDARAADFAAEVWHDPASSGVLSGRYVFGDTARLVVRQAQIDFHDRRWEASGDRLWIDFAPETFFFHNFALRSGPEHFVLAGRLSLVGAESLRVSLSNLDLSRYARLFGSNDQIHGMLDIEMLVSGTAQAPRLDGHFLINNGRIAEFTYQSWAGTFDYQDELLRWTFGLQQPSADSLTGEGFVPVRLALDGSPVQFYRDRPMRLQADAQRLDLSSLQAFTQTVQKVRGTLACDVEILGSFAQMRPGGTIRVFDGAFQLPQNRTAYHDLRLTMSLQPEEVALPFFEVLSDKGKLNASGTLRLNEQGGVASIAGYVLARDFPLANTRDLELQIDSDTTRFEGDANGLRYTGAVTIDRAIYYLRAIQSGRVLQIDAAELQPPQQAPPAKTDNGAWARLLDKIHGELKIRMPRNTWVRGPGINLELNGELDLVQEGRDYLLYGAIDILRGTYELYGKKFTVRNGKLIFQGDYTTAVQIDLLASYIFRQGKERHEMFVKITGALANPQIAFSLDNDDKAIEQKDAISYILFNVPAQGSGIDLTSTASGVVSGLVAQQLSKSLSESLKLDVIEFGSGEELTPGSVLVGKYLTNELFVSVSQDFSSFNSAEALRVTLELEVLRQFFLQATRGGKDEKDTGFDVIWKKEW